MNKYLTIELLKGFLKNSTEHRKFAKIIEEFSIHNAFDTTSKEDTWTCITKLLLDHPNQSLALLNVLVKAYSCGYKISRAPNNYLKIIFENVKYFKKVDQEILKLITLDFNEDKSTLLITKHDNVNRESPTYVLSNYKIKNAFLRNNIISFFRSKPNLHIFDLKRNLKDRSLIKESIIYFFENIETFFCKKIENVSDINDETLDRTIIKIKSECNDKEKLYYVLFLLLEFVKFISKKFVSECCKNLQKYTYFLSLRHKAHRLTEGYEVYTYPITESDINASGDKIILQIRNFNKLSTKFHEIDHCSFDFSHISSNFFKLIAKKHILNNPSLIISSALFELKYALNVITKFKQINNSSMDFISVDDCINLRESIDADYPSLATKNRIIGYIRRFFEYGKENKFLNLDTTSLQYLKQFGEPKPYNRKSLSHEEQNSLVHELQNISKESTKNKLIYLFIKILLSTSIRASQLVNLRKDSVILDHDGYKVSINTITKTSNKKIESQSYGSTIYKLIKESIYSSCEQSPYVFSYSTEYKNVKNEIKKLNLNLVNKTIKEISKVIGIESINIIKLRDTYMTNALQYATKNNFSDLQIQKLTGHKKLKTTITNYVDKDEFLSEYFEIAYGLDLSQDNLKDVNAHSHITNVKGDISQNVSEGCGFCALSADIKCNESHGQYSCLLCSHFTTTIEHKKYFISTIKSLNLKIEQEPHQHVKEELSAIKNICGCYLLAIEQQEKLNDKCSN